MKHSLPVALLLGLAACSATAPDPGSSEVKEQVAATKELFVQKAPHLREMFEQSYGYAIFPKVGKGGLIVGGGGGKGYVYEQGALVGGVTMSMVSLGAQVGGESFAEVIFFENEPVLREFKSGNFEFGATVNAVAAEASSSRHAKFDEGVAVFTVTRGGLMAEASVAGQKFTYAPVQK